MRGGGGGGAWDEIGWMSLLLHALVSAHMVGGRGALNPPLATADAGRRTAGPHALELGALAIEAGSETFGVVPLPVGPRGCRAGQGRGLGHDTLLLGQATAQRLSLAPWTVTQKE